MTTVYDFDRKQRLGMPEAVLCEGKDPGSLNALLRQLREQPDHPALFTRLYPTQFAQLEPALAADLDYEPVSGTAILHGLLPRRRGDVAVVTAGTSDLRVAREAERTLTFTGVAAALYADIGVAGVWRLLDRIEEIRRHDVVIVAAGMDAALASVMSGLVGKCVIGVPTSVGYGVAAGGHTALNAMLASCGQGLLVTNIDNGFGAACGAIRILNALHPEQSA
ncbi:MAG: nickel pincer cofactor biosynthesis protein LarB [Caulobacteraceae bacterium]|nr:nickel pincer cofactor biosynthesis protein LarB [Caulobacteraceae bacterium]